MTPHPEADTLFEISWEVCNKVGGIHTVIKSKLRYMQDRYDNYFLIGPLVARERNEFEETEPPREWKAIFNTLANQGMTCVYGTWMAPGQPTVILVDLSCDVNQLRKEYWERHKIDSIRAGWDFDEPMCWATGAGMLIEAYAQQTDERIVAHSHEWMAGFSTLYLKDTVATVFTTHATMLGRTIAGTGHPLYDMLDDVQPEEWASRLKIEEKHTTEVACAHAADVFTTVSEVTAAEAEKLLGRAPDVLLYNGFHIEKFPTFEETSIKHYESKEVLKGVAAYLFFPNYQFSLEKTKFFYASGRYEFVNKGLDVTVEALARLNHRLQQEGSDQTIIMFFWIIDQSNNGIRKTVLERKNLFSNVQNYVTWHTKPLIQKIVLDFLSGYRPGENDQFTSDFIKEMQANVRQPRIDEPAPVMTHEIPDDDPLVKACVAHGLTNTEEDRVKVVISPGALDGSDGLLNLPYYDAVVGTHLGIFASQYEPWGYTPLESAVVGVPAVTTDFAGFGRYIQTCYRGERPGIEVLRRKGMSREEIVENLAQYLYTFVHLSAQDRVREGFAAKTLANSCGWEQFGPRYIEAHNRALEER